MSFILDALRKSEHERRMETAPDIMHTPVAVTRQRLPIWAIALIGALAAALLAVTIYSVWQRFPGPEPAMGELQQPAPPPQPAPQAALPQAVSPTPQVSAPPAVTIEEPAVAAPPAQTPPLDSSAAAMRSEPSITTPAEVPVSSPTAEPTPVPRSEPIARVPASPPVNREPLPSYAALLADGMNIGTLQMQLHVHSSTPANRFVVINGTRRREGERLSEGLSIEEIVAEGAILNYQGRRFLLPPN
jgi:general secretion pathway protein B